MKKISICLMAGAMALTACNSWLQEEPKSFNDGSIHSVKEAEARVNYLYRRGFAVELATAPSAYIGAPISIDGMLTGYFTNSYEGQEVVCKYAGELTREDNTARISGTFETSWQRCYQAINTANNAIKVLPEADGVSAADVTRLVAEAKFFRGMNYFYLVKRFGDVPLLLEETAGIDSENITAPRTDSKAVLAQVMADLKDAEAGLPAATFSANNHRVTKYVAAMALSDVCMYTNDYANAATYAKTVMSAHKLTTNDNFKEGSYINKLRTTDDLNESVYAYEFNSSVSTSSWWPTYAFNSAATVVFNKYSIFERVYGVANGFLNVYDPKDLRVQNQQFFVWSYTNETTGKTWEAPDAVTPGSFYYFDQEAMEVTGRGTKDWNIYRAAEAYLNAAEGIAQTAGVTTEAAGYLAEIKARATEGKTVAQLTAELQVLSKEKFIEECWTERLREFPLENKIWADCVRTGKFPKINADHTVTYVDLATATNARGASFAGKCLLWPIGLSQLQRNPNLTQNGKYATQQ